MLRKLVVLGFAVLLTVAGCASQATTTSAPPSSTTSSSAVPTSMVAPITTTSQATTTTPPISSATSATAWPSRGLQPQETVNIIRGSLLKDETLRAYLPTALPAGFYVPRTYSAGGQSFPNPQVRASALLDSSNVTSDPYYALTLTNGKDTIVLSVNIAADAGDRTWTDTGIAVNGAHFKQVQGAAFLEAFDSARTKIDIDGTGGSLVGDGQLAEVLYIARHLAFKGTLTDEYQEIIDAAVKAGVPYFDYHAEILISGNYAGISMWSSMGAEDAPKTSPLSALLKWKAGNWAVVVYGATHDRQYWLARGAPRDLAEWLAPAPTTDTVSAPTTVTVPAPTTVTVPAVAAIGLSEAQAKVKLAQYGLKAKVVDMETPDFRPGLCFYQSPAAGAKVPMGSTVEIQIAVSPITTTTTAP